MAGLRTLIAGLAVLGGLLPASASADGVEVASHPSGARLLLSDTPEAARAALAPETLVESDGTGLRVNSLALELTFPGVTHGEVGAAPGADDPLLRVQTTAAGDVTFVGGAVISSVATVELVVRPPRGPERRVAVPTVPGEAYRGAWSGRLRFFLARVDDETGTVVRVRLLDGAGALIAIEEDDDPLLRGPITLRRGRLSRRTRWSIAAEARDLIASVPGRPDRHELGACIHLRVALGVQACRPERRSAAALLTRASDCNSGRVLVGGLVPRDVTRARLILGSGRRVPAALIPLPARLRLAGRALAAPAPPGEAVRAMLLRERRGREHRVRLGIPPAGNGCELESPGPDLSLSGLPSRPPGDGLVDFDPPRPRAPGVADHVATALPGARLVVRPEGDLLCLALERSPRVPADCTLPPALAAKPILLGRALPDGRIALAVVAPPTVASVALRPADFAPRPALADAATQPLIDGSPARGVLLAVPAPGPDEVPVAILRDADGRTLAQVALPRHAAGPPTTLARGAGWRLTRTRFVGAVAFRPASADPFLPVPRDCLQVTAGVPRTFPGSCTEAIGRVVLAEATCSPRRLHVFGSPVGRARRAVVLLAGGGRRTAAVRRGVFHVALRGRAGVHAVVLLDRRGRRFERHALRLPGPARQCGYRVRSLTSR